MARGFNSLGVGTSDILTTALTSHNAQRTYAVWAYHVTSGGGGFGRIFDKNALEVLFSNSGAVYEFSRSFSTQNGSWSITHPGNNVWAHLAITYDSSSTSNDPVMYLNGSSVSVTETSPPIGTANTDASAFNLGNRSSDVARCWDGMLAEFAAWNRILTAAEIAGLGKAFSPLHYPQSLVSYVPMVRGLQDYKGATTSVSGTAVQPHTRIIMPKRRQVIDVAAGGGGGGAVGVGLAAIEHGDIYGSPNACGSGLHRIEEGISA